MKREALQPEESIRHESTPNIEFVEIPNPMARPKSSFNIDLQRSDGYRMSVSSLATIEGAKELIQCFLSGGEK